MSKNDVAKDFQDSYESSNNGEYWGKYFDGATFNRVKKNKKDDMYGTPTPAFTTASISSSNWISFAPLCEQACTVPCDYSAPKLKCEPNKKEKTMYVDNDKHIESSKINYLSHRLEELYYKKDGEARKLFGLINDEPPETATDLVKRIQDGKFVIKDEVKDKVTYGDSARYITWRDPSVKEDKVAYKAAMKAYELLAQDARDTIAIGTPAEALAAVKALDAWTPTAK